MNNLSKYITRIESQEQANILLEELKKIDQKYKYDPNYAFFSKGECFFGIDGLDDHKEPFIVSIVGIGGDYFEKRQLISFNEFLQKIKENQKNLNLSDEEVFVLKQLVGILTPNDLKDIINKNLTVNTKEKQASIILLEKDKDFSFNLYEKLENFLRKNNITEKLFGTKLFYFHNGSTAKFLENNHIKIGDKTKQNETWLRIVQAMLDLADDYIILDGKRYNRKELIEFKKTIENL